MKIKPLFDRVVILPQKPQQTTSSGIILSMQQDKNSNIGTIVAVGEGGLFDGKQTKMQLAVGNKVVYSAYAGTQIKYDENEYIVIRQTDVFGIIEE